MRRPKLLKKTQAPISLFIFSFLTDQASPLPVYRFLNTEGQWKEALAIFFAFADAWKMYLSASSKLQNKNLRVANNTAIAQTPTRLLQMEE
ncbi:MAG: hypothetical protein ACLT8Y_00775 [Dorea formicigenerans]